MLGLLLYVAIELATVNKSLKLYNTAYQDFIEEMLHNGYKTDKETLDYLLIKIKEINDNNKLFATAIFLLPVINIYYAKKHNQNVVKKLHNEKRIKENITTMTRQEQLEYNQIPNNKKFEKIFFARIIANNNYKDATEIIELTPKTVHEDDFLVLGTPLEKEEKFTQEEIKLINDQLNKNSYQKERKNYYCLHYKDKNIAVLGVPYQEEKFKVKRVYSMTDPAPIASVQEIPRQEEQENVYEPYLYHPNIRTNALCQESIDYVLRLRLLNTMNIEENTSNQIVKVKKQLKK